MKRTTLTLVGAVLAALVVATGAAAAAPGDAGSTDDRAAAGPPSDLPGPVPDFVTDVLDAIRSFLTGGNDGSPGPAVSDAAGNGG